MTDIQDTTYISVEFNKAVGQILTEEEIADFSQIPAENPLGHKTIAKSPNELDYVLAYAALLKSAQTLDEESGQVFRYFAKLTIRKMSKKISENRRLMLLHLVAISSCFNHRNLPAFFIVLFEKDQSV